MIWITSDFHFGHEKEFLWQPRGFISWEDHAESIIKNYNEVIDKDDEVYILGDCVLKNDDFGIECLKQLKGHKYLAVGNHDSNLRINKYEEAIFVILKYLENEEACFLLTSHEFQLFDMHTGAFSSS